MAIGTVKTGLMRVLEDGSGLGARLKGKRLGMLVNPTSVDGGLVHAVDRALAKGWKVERLFGPEHGLRGEAQDMIAVQDRKDPLSGLPVVSLYGHEERTLRPAPGALDGLDVVLIDLQDIGTRYYTFAYTAALMVEACARDGVEAWVLDRPNPLGGEVLEGNVGVGTLKSFVGMYPPLAVRHGMTMGEVVGMLSARHGWGAALQVVPMEGWKRAMYFEDTGLPWVMPSPNMPTVETAFVYPGQCLWEGTNVSEGRGTTKPFEIFGAPWVDARDVLAVLDPVALRGCVLRPLVFQPTFHKHRGEGCGGFQIHVTDRGAFRSWATALGLLQALRSLYPEDFGWRRERYEFVSDRLAIDLLIGDTTLRHGLEDGMALVELLEACEGSRERFEAERGQFLLY